MARNEGGFGSWINLELCLPSNPQIKTSAMPGTAKSAPRDQIQGPPAEIGATIAGLPGFWGAS